jgi:hypothetical protein
MSRIFLMKVMQNICMMCYSKLFILLREMYSVLISVIFDRCMQT